MKLIAFCLLCLVIFYTRVGAVNNLRLSDIRSMGMGGNEVTQSSLLNPSLIALQSNRKLQINYFNRYSLKELQTVNGSFQCSNPILPIGVDIFSFGYDAYRESMFRLSGSKLLGDKWSLGISVQYAILQTELCEENISRLSTDIGSTFHPVDNLLVGMLITNLPSVSIKNNITEIKDFTFYLIQIGFQWKIINNMLIAGSIGTNNEHTVICNAGIEYTVFDAFFVRAGIRSDPVLPSLGVGYNLYHFIIDVAALYHPELGISTGIGLSFSF